MINFSKILNQDICITYLLNFFSSAKPKMEKCRSVYFEPRSGLTGPKTVVSAIQEEASSDTKKRGRLSLPTGFKQLFSLKNKNKKTIVEQEASGL